jgi:lysophospholipase L1-like esterase
VTTRSKVLGALAILVVGAVAAGFAIAIAAGTDTGGGVRKRAIVAFYGDSYTLGTGASSPEKRWSTIICEERAWTEVNPSTNGLGFVNNRTATIDEPGKVIAAHPDIVFITMGLNDNFSYPQFKGAIFANITADFERMKKALPNARFIVVEPFWYSDDRPESVGIINGWVKDAAAAIHADYIPGASYWIEGHPEWMAVDGLHPNDEGYAAIVRQMDKALAKLGLH